MSIKNYFCLLFIFIFSLACFSQNKSNVDEIDSLKSLIKKSRTFLIESKFQQSLIVANLALQKAIVQKNDTMVAYSYYVLGENFLKLSDFDKSIINYKKGLEFANNANNQYIKKMICNNIANVLCFEKKEYAEGIHFYKEALDFNEKSKFQVQRNNLVKANIAWAYFDWGKYDQGYVYLNDVTKQVELLGENYGEKESIMIVYMLNALYFNHKNDFRNAKLYFEKGLEVSENNDFFNKIYLLEEYANFLSKSGDNKNAFLTYKKFHKLRQKIYNDKNMEAANLSAVQVQLQDYKQEIKVIEKKNIEQSEKLKNSKIITSTLLFAFIALALFFYFMYKNYRLEKVTTKKLEAINKELNISKEKAEEASVLKTQFISTITHELRTPLYGVVGISNILIEDHINPENESHLESLKFSANYLLTLVNDVLQMSKIEEGTLGLENSDFNLNTNIIALKNSLQFIADNNNVAFKIDIDPKIPKNLYGDSQKLAQILINLVTNALKFTQNGTVTVSLKLDRIEKNIYFILFQVIDNGIGIADENQIKIFDNFTQIKQNKQEFEGTGLGLSIVKKILHLFKSEIYLKSELGNGATFSFTIGFEKQGDNQKQPIIEKTLLPHKNNLKILIVEDNRINQMVTKRIIERENHTCEIVDNGLKAIDILKKQSFDLVLMDINMPEINGYEATKKIREFNNEIIIVALTASAKEQVSEAAFESGMNEIIIKPFIPEDFFEIIYKLI